jgi:large subunit ribosomal protein L19
MTTKIEDFNKTQLRQDIPDIRPGDTVRVYQKIKEKDKERIQLFEGIVLARKHGKGISATITVRKIISGIGVEKIFPIHSPSIEKMEVTKRSKVRRAKLYYLRTAKGKKAKLKRKDFAQAISNEDKKPKIVEEKPTDTVPELKTEPKEDNKTEKEIKRAEEK